MWHRRRRLRRVDPAARHVRSSTAAANEPGGAAAGQRAVTLHRPDSGASDSSQAAIDRAAAGAMETAHDNETLRGHPAHRPELIGDVPVITLPERLLAAVLISSTLELLLKTGRCRCN